MADASMASVLKAYSVPLLLFSLAIFFQLFVIPTSFPPSHYEVLGIKPYSSIEEVAEAYEKLSSKWNSGEEELSTVDFIKIRYAFELLTNPLWKRDYDSFGIDEQLHTLEEVKGKYAGETFSKVALPLLNASSSDAADHAFNVLTTEEFRNTIGSSKASLVQVYSSGSNHCAQFSYNWKRITNLLDGVASTGMVELGEVQLAMYLSERKSTGQPFFRNGLPSLVAFPPGCRSSDCLVRYQGDLSVDAVTDWFATSILGLPRILYYSKESLGQQFIAKSGHHKVKVLCFSKTGERAAPFLRQAAKDYWAFASFASILWREEESSVWWNTFEVESAPAFVFLKDPGVKPVVFHGTMNSSSFLNIMEQNKQHGLPQLRSITSMELGCDARGYSRAGYEAMTWYCVILAGRPSLELNKLRETMLRVQDKISNNGKSNADDKDSISAPPAAAALKDKRLTFAWLDGEAQQKYCFFYLHSENSYETCGPRRDLTDVPQIFIVRYKRNFTKDEETKAKRKPKTIWDTFQEDDENFASQLVAKYNGSGDIPQIIQWVSQIIKDGDSTDLPYFRTKTPDLIPEESDPIWSRGTQRVFPTSQGLKQRVQGIITSMHDHMGDPRLGPILLLAAVLSFGSIWLHRSQSSPSNQPSQSSQTSQSTQPSQSSQLATEEKPSRNRRARRRAVSNKDQPPSLTDNEPKDAYQMLPSDSDSE
ncbi:DnaJ domain [Macleaya cordata]|uniref:DnaJ domain n=1 Tax=Macleaya cordata TaxID=56857 RepID=A0A200QP17_MACCD|nr:DnaJ domain [Macleaya cordata]